MTWMLGLCSLLRRAYLTSQGPIRMSISSSSMAVRLSVCPASALVDDPVHIRVTGLKSGQKVTVQAVLEEDGVKFGSFGHYLSDHQGSVDLKTNPSHGGTYTGLEPMGLFWSKRAIPGQKPGLRLLKRDVTVPYRVQVYVREGYLPWRELWGSLPAPMATAEVLRYYMSQDVTRTEIEHGRVRGTLFVPPGKGPFPGVIDLFGTAGGLLEFRAALLASRGFTTFAMAYFNYKDLPLGMEDMSLDYFLEAVDWFSSLPEVQPHGIGVGGVSKGGELALLLTAYCNQVSACININGPPHLTVYPMKFGDTYLPAADFDKDKLIHTEEGVRLSYACTYQREHVIPFGRSRAKFLVLLAGDDGGYNGDNTRLEFSLLPESKQRDVEIITYEGAGHLIEPPYAPHTRVAYYSLIKTLGEKENSPKNAPSYVVWGGRPQPHSKAQEHSWARIIQFYRDHVGYNSIRQSKL